MCGKPTPTTIGAPVQGAFVEQGVGVLCLGGVLGAVSHSYAPACVLEGAGEQGAPGHIGKSRRVGGHLAACLLTRAWGDPDGSVGHRTSGLSSGSCPCFVNYLYASSCMDCSGIPSRWEGGAMYQIIRKLIKQTKNCMV